MKTLADFNDASSGSGSHQKSPDDVTYKLIFLARHGEGVHNVAKDFYGGKDWFLEWSAKEGNGTVVWADAHLSPKGIEECKNMSAAWQRQLDRPDGAPIPERFYVSPLYRACETANFTFSGLKAPNRPRGKDGKVFEPVVIRESLREFLLHFTSNRRSNATYIHSSFPDFGFEPGFTEQDEMWEDDAFEGFTKDNVILRVGGDGIVARMQGFLDQVWAEGIDDFWAEDGPPTDEDGNPKAEWSGERPSVVSLTTHSIAANAILALFHHPLRFLPTGGMVPVVVRGVRIPWDSEERRALFHGVKVMNDFY